MGRESAREAAARESGDRESPGRGPVARESGGADCGAGYDWRPSGRLPSVRAGGADCGRSADGRWYRRSGSGSRSGRGTGRFQDGSGRCVAGGELVGEELAGCELVDGPAT
jgi:hypothetical protein